MEEVARRESKLEQSKARFNVAIQAMKSILSNPTCSKDPKEVATFAVLCADNLVSVLETTQAVKDKLDGI